MTTTKMAPLPAMALAAILAMGVALPGPALAQEACLSEVDGGTRAMLKQALACQQETAKATNALAEKASANAAAIGALAKDLAAMKSDMQTVRDDVRQLGSAMAAVEVVVANTNKKIAQPPKMPDFSGVTQALGQRFDALAARMEKMMAKSQTPPSSN